MKLFKKLAAALVATMLVMAMIGTSAFAATVNTSGTTPVDISSHTFTAYQIFKGTQGSGSVLSDIDWADGFDKDGFVTELAATFTDKGFATNKSAAEIADIIGTFDSYTANAEKIAQIAYKHLGTAAGKELELGKDNDVSAGYYLIVDTTEVDGKDDVANAALLQVTDTITINVKTDKPKVEKKVIENTKYEQRGSGSLNYNGGNYLVEHENDTADYNIGDNVPFKLHSVVPDMSHYVGPYVYIFHDTMAASLTYNNDAKVYVNGEEVASGKYTPTISGQELTVKIPDLDAIADQGDLVTVEFTAKLNENAYIGRDADASGTGNVNKVYLEYSNQPNGAGSGTGKTPEDKVIVFTYKLDVNKVDPSGTRLDGAKFKFYKKSGTTKVYVDVDGENKVAGWTTNSGSAKEFTSTSGTFGIIGLDAGTYYLVETEAPANYNKLAAPIEVVITADTTNGQEGNALVTELADVFVKADDKSGTTSSGTDMALSFDVVNKQGTILPSTGGIGTTIFYVLGAILVLGGGVLLVTRRRMAA